MKLRENLCLLGRRRGATGEGERWGVWGKVKKSGKYEAGAGGVVSEL